MNSNLGSTPERISSALQAFPWVYERGNKPALLISTLKPLAVLVSLKLYYGDDPGPNTTSVTLVPTFTENWENGSALNKLMSTRFLSSELLMELSVFLKKRKIKALVEWAPSESNKEAGALANGVTDGFKDALDAGRHAKESHKMAKERGQLPNRAKKERREET